MNLLGRRTFALATIEYERHVPLSSWQYTNTRPHKPFATMAGQLHDKTADLSTWSADQLIARVIFLEQQLKEQTAKCVNLYAPLQTILIA